MTISIPAKPALVLIDIQKGFNNVAYWGEERNNLDAEQRAFQLLELWRVLNLPIYHIQHCSTIPTSLLNASNEGNDFQNIVRPKEHETVIQKKVNSAFIGTDLKDRLENAAIKNLVLVGLTTDHCVSTTARMAANYGFTTFVVADATATFNRTSLTGQKYSAQLMHETALASLSGEFAEIVTASSIENELLRKSKAL